LVIPPTRHLTSTTRFRGSLRILPSTSTSPIRVTHLWSRQRAEVGCSRRQSVHRQPRAGSHPPTVGHAAAWVRADLHGRAGRAGRRKGYPAVL
jgi:hypothetical protein